MAEPKSAENGTALSRDDIEGVQAQDDGSVAPEPVKEPGKKAGKESKKIKVLSDKLERANRVLSAAKRSIDSLKGKLKEKETLLKENKLKHGKLLDIVRRAQEENEELKAAVAAGNKESDDDAAEVTAAVPTRALRCVEHDGQVWYFVQSDDQSMEWMEAMEVYRRAGSDELDFDLPPACISVEESEKLRLEAEAMHRDLQKVTENFRRFRVRSEIVRKQKEAELARITDNNLKYKQHNIVGQDVQEELKLAQMKVEKLTQDHAASEVARERLEDELKKLQQDMRKRESEIRRQKSESFYADRDTSTGYNGSAATEREGSALKLTDQLAKLKREYDNYRTRVLGLLQNKDDEIAKLKAKSDGADSAAENIVTPGPKQSTGAGRGQTSPQSAPASKLDRRNTASSMSKILVKKKRSVDTAYLKNIILKYMAADGEPETREHMEAAIATVLEFTPEDVQFIHRKRTASSPNLLKRSTWRFF